MYLFETERDLTRNVADALLWQSVKAVCAEVPEEVATAGKLGHEVGLELHCELLNKVDHLSGSLARVHRIALANCIFRAEALIFRSLHGLDRNAHARVFVHAAPDRVAAALTNLILNLVLVKRA